jgi:hypothetical protein
MKNMILNKSFRFEILTVDDTYEAWMQVGTRCHSSSLSSVLKHEIYFFNCITNDVSLYLS